MVVTGARAGSPKTQLIKILREADKTPVAEIRQVIGWREYVRGVHWHFMPAYVDRNALGAGRPLPNLYWTGDTAMNCLRDAVGQTLEYGYAHHIQRPNVCGPTVTPRAGLSSPRGGEGGTRAC